MAHCPVCNANVDADFGLVECTGCGVQLIVRDDGGVEYQGNQSKPEAAGTQIHAIPEAEDMEAATDGFEASENSVAPDEEFNFSVPEPERIVDFDVQASIDSDATQLQIPDFVAPEAEGTFAGLPEDEIMEGAPEPAAEYSFDEESGDREPAPPAYTSASSPGSSDLSDVARFGNSDISGSRDGALRYTVFIEGIDTSDVRIAFREALTDRKFVWDIDNILRSVRNGEVTIPNVSPAKAYILISRLRNLPLRVRWEQYAIHQT